MTNRVLRCAHVALEGSWCMTWAVEMTATSPGPFGYGALPRVLMVRLLMMDHMTFVSVKRQDSRHACREQG